MARRCDSFDLPGTGTTNGEPYTLFFNAPPHPMSPYSPGVHLSSPPKPHEHRKRHDFAPKLGRVIPVAAARVRL